MLTDPVLLIEILSPGNQAETWIDVWSCTTIPSVRETLVFETERACALELRRGADGRWPDQALAVSGGDLLLESIGFHLPIEDVYRSTWLATGQDQTQA